MSSLLSAMKISEAAEGLESLTLPLSVHSGSGLACQPDPGTSATLYRLLIDRPSICGQAQVRSLSPHTLSLVCGTTEFYLGCLVLPASPAKPLHWSPRRVAVEGGGGKGENLMFLFWIVRCWRAYGINKSTGTIQFLQGRAWVATLYFSQSFQLLLVSSDWYLDWTSERLFKMWKAGMCKNLVDN